MDTTAAPAAFASAGKISGTGGVDSPFRADFTAEYGDLMFVNAEIADKAFSPDILDEMAQENKLTTLRILAHSVFPAFPPATMYRAVATASQRRTATLWRLPRTLVY